MAHVSTEGLGQRRRQQQLCSNSSPDAQSPNSPPPPPHPQPSPKNQTVADSGAVPPGNAPGETKWSGAPKRAKAEIKLTAGKAINVPIEKLIDGVVKENKVVAFVKGTRSQPQCGFSHKLMTILNDLKADYEVVNVLVGGGLGVGGWDVRSGLIDSCWDVVSSGLDCTAVVLPPPMRPRQPQTTASKTAPKPPPPRTTSTTPGCGTRSRSTASGPPSRSSTSRGSLWAAPTSWTRCWARGSCSCCCGGRNSEGGEK